MRIDPSFIQCECGRAVKVLDKKTGEFTCETPGCPQFGKVFAAATLAVDAKREAEVRTNEPFVADPQRDKFES